MDQHDHRPGEEPRDHRAPQRQGSGGSANTPTFGSDPAAPDRAYPDRSTDDADGSADEFATPEMQASTNRIHQYDSRFDEENDESTESRPDGRFLEDGSSSGEGMGFVADYLRDSDLADLKEGLERQVRERPLQSLLVGLAAGWLLGKVLK